MTEIEQYKKIVGVLIGALEQYANPEFYHAIMVLADRPAGGFADDLSEVEHYFYDRPMHGKLARDTLQRLADEYGDVAYTEEAQACEART